MTNVIILCSSSSQTDSDYTLLTYFSCIEPCPMSGICYCENRKFCICMPHNDWDLLPVYLRWRNLPEIYHYKFIKRPGHVRIRYFRSLFLSLYILDLLSTCSQLWASIPCDAFCGGIRNSDRNHISIHPGKKNWRNIDPSCQPVRGCLARLFCLAFLFRVGVII